MTQVIARKEFIEMLRDGRVRWTGGIVLVLLAVAFLTGWTRHHELTRQHSAAQEATRKHWLTQGKKNPHSAAHYGIYAFKPKLPLAVLDTGTEPTGVAVWLEAHKQNEFKYRPAQDATILARFGELTAAAVMQLLIPLLIIIMTFGAFAGEREQGTLRQLLSLGVPARRLALGKALGLLAGLGVYLVPAVLLGAGAILLPAEPWSLPQVLRGPYGWRWRIFCTSSRSPPLDSRYRPGHARRASHSSRSSASGS